MQAPKEIHTVWQKFDYFPMETLTKAWYFSRTKGKKQREVALMREHRDQYGVTGNCFDLAIWLLDEFTNAGIKAYPIGHDLHTEKAHVAIIAHDEQGIRYLCDLGDQWLQPILIDSKAEGFTNEHLSGFFPAAKVQVIPRDKDIMVSYQRPNGKTSKQTYDTTPIEMSIFLSAAEFSQNLIKPRPLLECRVPYVDEVAHWEFYNWNSFMSTSKGLFHEQTVETVEEWAEKISSITGYKKEFLTEALKVYKK